MIQHVTRRIPPALLDECVRFYGILGFVRVPMPASLVGRAVWLGAGGGAGSHIHLMPADDAIPEQGHVALVVEEYQAAVARLRDAGFEVEPRREHWGASRSYVRDPASNVVELMAAAPGQPPQCRS